MHGNGEVKSGAENGHSVPAPASPNGSNAPVASNGGRGVSSFIAAADQGEKYRRSEVRLIQRALERGWMNPWSIDTAVFQGAVNEVVKIRDAAFHKGDLRTAATASDIIRKFASDNVTLVGMLDKAERLDAGESTENVRQEVRVVAIEPDRRG